ncbi:hypothetical protein [Shimia thalassica]|uniref:hypothetical protein n=1 Tax=Shimia thalassica TaxID=1715693 RepID=UPI0026E48E58|nr:hypothetical protein [Shimia thalassica]MDO6480968.1 hypothetical protein [Shimia thalassica]
MTDLEEALDTLKDRLGKAGNASETVKDTAEEYGLHPGLLRRKFKERYSTAPEEYVPSTSFTTMSRRRARKNALDWAWNSHGELKTITMTQEAFQVFQEGKEGWIVDHVRKCHLGAIFKEGRREYAFAGLTSSNKIMAIPVDDTGPSDENSFLEHVQWLTGNPNLAFVTEQQAYEWLQERTIVGANVNLS